jgi:putative ABC transport system permease protein
MPLVVDASTYGVGVAFALLATAASAVLVGRRVRRLDLIRVLKTRE